MLVMHENLEAGMCVLAGRSKHVNSPLAFF